MWWLWLVIGLVAGATIGMLVMACCAVAGYEDDAMHAAAFYEAFVEDERTG